MSPEITLVGCCQYKTKRKVWTIKEKLSVHRVQVTAELNAQVCAHAFPHRTVTVVFA